ncbi:MAG: RNA methyltransferase, partial [Clostridiales bacterium]|nr:RNA methyltransferase [Clostridiales bacterium]
CDGIRLLREAVSSSCIVTAVFAASEQKAHELESELSAHVCFVTGDIMKNVSPLKTAQDVLFSCKIPKSRMIDIRAKNIVLDGLGDPGNVGTVMRGAAAFEIDSVVLCGDSADPYNPKTVRATMGAIFRQNVVRMDYRELGECVLNGLELYGADAGKNSRDVRGLDLRGVSIAIGSEGAGLSDEIKALCRELVAIPMEPGAESLNAGVAANLFMWMMYKGGPDADA